MIDTDGYAVSMHFVPPHLHGATAYNGGKVASKRTSKTAKARKRVKREWPYVHELSQDERAELLRDEHLLAGVDPGKRDLVTVCDGCEGRKGPIQRRPAALGAVQQTPQGAEAAPAPLSGAGGLSLP